MRARSAAPVVNWPPMRIFSSIVRPGNTPSLRHVGHAAADAVIGAQPRDVLAGKRDRALPGRHQAEEHVQERGLAGAVGAEQHHRLARARRSSPALPKTCTLP